MEQQQQGANGHDCFQSQFRSNGHIANSGNYLGMDGATQMQLSSGFQTWQWKNPYEWRFIAGKIIELDGRFPLISHLPSGILTQILKITHFQWTRIFQTLQARVYVNLLEGIFRRYLRGSAQFQQCVSSQTACPMRVFGTQLVPSN